MNLKMVLKSLGTLLICEAIALLPSILVSSIYKDGSGMSFVYTLLLLTVIGVPLTRLKPKTNSIYARDGFTIVAAGWIIISLFGALPYYLSGAIPSFADSFFEAVSGFTTTGASILNNIEVLPASILFWRSLTNWLGGMGVLVLSLAILPSIGAGSLQIMKAEVPGPNPGKIVPRIRNTVRILYKIYLSITIIEVVLLLISGMPFYDSLIHSFGTTGTGGVSNKNFNIAAYDNAIAEIVITVFMLICGVNFTLYYQAIKGNIKALLKDEEFRFYIGIVVVAIMLISINLHGNVYTSIGESLRHSSFQVASVITTTGYSSTNFDTWPLFSKMILFILMFIGGSSGSTVGAIKSIRVLLLLKSVRIEMKSIIHPKAVYSVRIGNKTIEEETLSEVKNFFFAYMLIFVLAVIIVSLDGFDFSTTLSAAAASLGNIGVGFGDIGPLGNYSNMSGLSKTVLSICMLMGRLEIYPILVLAMPSLWKK